MKIKKWRINKDINLKYYHLGFLHSLPWIPRILFPVQKPAWVLEPGRDGTIEEPDPCRTHES